MGKVKEYMSKLAPVLNANSFSIALEGIDEQEITIYPNNPETNTKDYSFILREDGSIKLKINRISELFIEREYDSFDSFLIDLITIESKNGGGYPHPQLKEILPIIEVCHEFRCIRNKNNAQFKASFLDENISLLVEVSKDGIRYMISSDTNPKFNSELKEIRNFKKLHNIAYAMQYCGNLNPIDMVQLTEKCTECLFNTDKTIEFHFPNNYGLKIGYFTSTGEWEIIGLKKELGEWTKQKTLITNEYSKLEKNIEEIPKKTKV